MMKNHIRSLFFVLVLIFGTIFVSNIYQIENTSQSLSDYTNSTNLKLNYVPNIVHDGIISTNEYEYSFIQHDSPNYVIHYTINRSVLYMALEVEAKGWVRVGFGYYTSGDDADIIVAYYDEINGTTYIQDSYSDGNGNHLPDDVNNVLSFAGSENDTSTIIEFSRQINTGDTLQDYEIIPGIVRAISWAFHETADDFTTPQNWQNSGAIRISLNGDPSSPYGTYGIADLNKATVYWSKSKGDGDDTTFGTSSITHYNIYRSTNGGTYQLIDNVLSTSSYLSILSYTDTSAVGGNNYSYAVTAVTSSGESGYSNIADVSTFTTSEIVTTISHDGSIAPSEYEFYKVLQLSPLYVMYYTINRSVLYVGLMVEAKGWVRVGFGYYTSGNDADIFVGYYDSTNGTAYAQDSYADRNGNHQPDTIDNVLSFAGNETDKYTIMEFSRAINTGDTTDTDSGEYIYPDDYEIIPGVNLGLSWAFHPTADNFTIPHNWQNAGSIRTTLNGDPGSPYDAFAIPTAGKVDLIWNKPKGDGNDTTYGTSSITQYNIYRSQEGSNYELIDNITFTTYSSYLSYVDTSVTDGTRYNYAITAVTSSGESGFSNIVDVLAFNESNAAPYNADGIISPGEYQYYTIIQMNPDYIIYYSIIESTLYMAIEVDANGWVAIGFYYSIDMGESDIIIGYFDTTDNTSHIEDNHAIATIAHAPDANNNLLTGYVGETNATTTMEFSRYLDTGDASDDYQIIPNDAFRIIWGSHSTADDFYSYHNEWNRYGSYALTLYGPPEAPYNLNTTVSENQIELTWDRPRGNDGLPTTDYNIYRSHNGGDIQLLTSLTYSSSLLSYIDTSIITGDTYTYYMTAVNVDGESGISNIVTAIPIGVLTPPRNINIVPNSGRVEISWDAPLNDGGLPIEEYIIYRSDSLDGNYTVIGTNTSKLGFIDYSIINGNTYYYMVRASHRILISDPTDIVSARPVGVTSPPLDLIIFSEDIVVTLQWTVPLSDGGFPILNYNIYRSEIQGGPYIQIASNISSLQYVDNAVENAKTYYYVVTAVNSFGESDTSSEQQITLANVPNAPTNLFVINGDNQVYLEWVAADGKGYEIINYTIYRSTGIGEKYTNIGSTISTNYTDITVVNGISYYYVVSSSSIVGESSYSSQIIGLPGDAPSSPLNVSATSVNGNVKLIWESPEDNGGYFISYYNIYRSTTSDGEFEKIGISYTGEYIDDQVIIGTTYYYIIAGVNDIGEGVYSIMILVTPGTEPDAPTNIIINMSEGGIELTWDQPINNGGTDIIQYSIYRSTTSGEPYDLIGTSQSTSFIDGNYEKGRIYYYVIIAENIYGKSEYSIEVNIIPSGLPSAPENLIGLAGNNQVVLSWELSQSDGGSPITTYNIYRSVVNGTQYTLIDNIFSIAYVDNTVINNQTYFYVITAVNANGESLYSNQISITPVSSELTFNFNNEDLYNLTNINDTSLVEINFEQLQPGKIISTSMGVVSLSAIIGLIYIARKKTSL